jgi:hypothetical protein
MVSERLADFGRSGKRDGFDAYPGALIQLLRRLQRLSLYAQQRCLLRNVVGVNGQHAQRQTQNDDADPLNWPSFLGRRRKMEFALAFMATGICNTFAFWMLIFRRWWFRGSGLLLAGIRLSIAAAVLSFQQ